MSDESTIRKFQPRRVPRNRRISRALLVTEREMLLAQLLLLVADRVAQNDEDQDFLHLYNECKSFAEGVLR